MLVKRAIGTNCYRSAGLIFLIKALSACLSAGPGLLGQLALGLWVNYEHAILDNEFLPLALLSGLDGLSLIEVPTVEVGP